jgi:LPS-assembly protein
MRRGETRLFQRPRLAVALWLLTTTMLPWMVQAEDSKTGPGSTPMLMNADDLRYDESTGVVTARGNIELSQGERVLIADLVSYNRTTDTVTAIGNVSLMEPNGEVLFSNYAVLQNELKTGVIENLRVLLSDGSRVAANHAERTAGGRKIMEQGVFSPCSLCRKDPTRAPLWQIKANKIIHHETRNDIEYRGAVLEMFGVPVLYTPYLVHPDPTVDRRSGLLAPLGRARLHLWSTLFSDDRRIE